VEQDKLVVFSLFGAQSEDIVSNSVANAFSGEDWGAYGKLIQKGGNEILKNAFDAQEKLTPDQGKYLGMREIMMALIVMAAEKDAKVGRTK
jgi:hypothetical protein